MHTFSMLASYMQHVHTRRHTLTYTHIHTYAFTEFTYQQTYNLTSIPAYIDFKLNLRHFGPKSSARLMARFLPPQTLNIP